MNFLNILSNDDMYENKNSGVYYQQSPQKHHKINHHQVNPPYNTTNHQVTNKQSIPNYQGQSTFKNLNNILYDVSSPNNSDKHLMNKPSNITNKQTPHIVDHPGISNINKPNITRTHHNNIHDHKPYNLQPVNNMLYSVDSSIHTNKYQDDIRHHSDVDKHKKHINTRVANEPQHIQHLNPPQHVRRTWAQAKANIAGKMAEHLDQRQQQHNDHYIPINRISLYTDDKICDSNQSEFKLKSMAVAKNNQVVHPSNDAFDISSKNIMNGTSFSIPSEFKKHMNNNTIHIYKDIPLDNSDSFPIYQQQPMVSEEYRLSHSSKKYSGTIYSDDLADDVHHITTPVKKQIKHLSRKGNRYIASDFSKSERYHDQDVNRDVDIDYKSNFDDVNHHYSYTDSGHIYSYSRPDNIKNTSNKSQHQSNNIHIDHQLMSRSEKYNDMILEDINNQHINTICVVEKESDDDSVSTDDEINDDLANDIDMPLNENKSYDDLDVRNIDIVDAINKTPINISKNISHVISSTPINISKNISHVISSTSINNNTTRKTPVGKPTINNNTTSPPKSKNTQTKDISKNTQTRDISKNKQTRDISKNTSTINTSKNVSTRDTKIILKNTKLKSDNMQSKNTYRTPYNEDQILHLLLADPSEYTSFNHEQCHDIEKINFGKNFCETYSKGLKHDINGNVDFASMKMLLDGIKYKDISNIPKNLLDVCSAWQISTDGLYKSYNLPSLSSLRISKDIIELYCMSICRDIPFNNYYNIYPHTLISTCCNHLNFIHKCKKYTYSNIFKGIHGYGLYISQFLYLNIGAVEQKYSLISLDSPMNNHMDTYDAAAYIIYGMTDDRQNDGYVAILESTIISDGGLINDKELIDEEIIDNEILVTDSEGLVDGELLDNAKLVTNNKKLIDEELVDNETPQTIKSKIIKRNKKSSKIASKSFKSHTGHIWKMSLADDIEDISTNNNFYVKDDMLNVSVRQHIFVNEKIDDLQEPPSQHEATIIQQMLLVDEHSQDKSLKSIGVEATPFVGRLDHTSPKSIVDRSTPSINQLNHTSSKSIVDRSTLSLNQLNHTSPKSIVDRSTPSVNQMNNTLSKSMVDGSSLSVNQINNISSKSIEKSSPSANQMNNTSSKSIKGSFLSTDQLNDNPSKSIFKERLPYVNQLYNAPHESIGKSSPSVNHISPKSIDESSLFTNQLTNKSKSIFGDESSINQLTNKHTFYDGEQSTTPNIYRYIITGRDLAIYSRNCDPLQPWYNTCDILRSLNVPLNVKHTNNITMFSEIKNTLSLVGKNALLIAFSKKWNCLYPCPEELGLRIEKMFNTKHNECSFSSSLIQVLGKLRTHTGHSLLSQTHQTGAQHCPSFPCHIAVVAGACSTCLKFYFTTQQQFSIYQPSNDGYRIQLTDKVTTVNDELDKLAWNMGYGGCWAGTNYRMDVIYGIKLGEHIALKHLQSIIHRYPKTSISIPLINGNKIITVESR